MTWQDISTAPKDGTEVLALWAAGRTHGIVYWDTDDGAGWLDQADKGYVSDPTHWMPLPPPPGSDDEFIAIPV